MNVASNVILVPRLGHFIDIVQTISVHGGVPHKIPRIKSVFRYPKKSP